MISGGYSPTVKVGLYELGFVAKHYPLCVFIGNGAVPLGTCSVLCSTKPSLFEGSCRQPKFCTAGTSTSIKFTLPVGSTDRLRRSLDRRLHNHSIPSPSHRFGMWIHRDSPEPVSRWSAFRCPPSSCSTPRVGARRNHESMVQAGTYRELHIRGSVSGGHRKRGVVL